MDSKKAQKVINELDYIDLIESDEPIFIEEESDFVPNSILAGFDCREVFEVLPNGNIRKTIEFEALREDSEEEVTDEVKEKLKVLAYKKSETIKTDFMTTLNLLLIEDKEEREQAIKEVYDKIKLGERNAKEDTLIDLIIEGKVDPKEYEGKTIKIKPNYDNNYSNVNNSAYVVDKDKAASSNKQYKRQKDEVDKYYDKLDEEMLRRAKLREIGIPYDETYISDKNFHNRWNSISALSMATGFFFFKYNTDIVSSLIDSSNTASIFLMLVGVAGLSINHCISKSQNLKYRDEVYELQQAYLNSNGKISEEEIKEIMGVYEVNKIDKYALACMTQEEREETISKARNPYELTQKQKAKRIKQALSNYKKYGSTKVNHSKEPEELTR